MSSSEPVRPVDLPAAEALRLALRAQAAARAPRSLPVWFGPAFAVSFALYGTGVGQATHAHLAWLSILLAVAFAALTVCLAVVTARSGGIVHRLEPAFGHLVRRAFLQLVGAALVAAGLAFACGGDARWVGAAVGIAAGAAFWAGAVWLNARIRRELGAR
ncbi:hypothetical protein J5Y04_19525 [Kitasatospora sp. RG8]|uniref:hypothetical protein n=1 Tax=Kitasatospora sp. RG8 TaxID=2820815 RepID=UPI001AE09132|nr:hypothetical protein [Kitasatospora sp. RG8]MBP0451718.1 hypothetical protein [Kitasatospora sp. RG8]